MKLTEFCENFLVFANGQEALDSLTAIINKGGDIPQLILLDLNMPVMDGWEFLEEFTKTNPPKEITIYILTSSIDPRDLKRAKQFNRVSNYVIKPITIENLESIKNSLT